MEHISEMMFKVILKRGESTGHFYKGKTVPGIHPDKVTHPH